jgi:hypothetical protein
VEAAAQCDLSGIPERKVCAADRVGSRFEVPRRLGVLAGAGKFLIDRSNVCTFVIGSVQQRPTKSIWGMSGDLETHSTASFNYVLKTLLAGCIIVWVERGADPLHALLQIPTPQIINPLANSFLRLPLELRV